MRIDITFGTGAKAATVRGTLNDSPCAQAIARALPIEARANTWGEEIYFAIPVRAGLEPGATDVRAAGDVAYWPPGHAFCIFFGRTPASRGGEPRAASPVNLVGRLDWDQAARSVLQAVRAGTPVKLSAGEDRGSDTDR